MDKSVKKGGAGAHSWGNLLDDASLYPVDDDDISEDEDTNSGDQGKSEPTGRPRSESEGRLRPDSPKVELETSGVSSPKSTRARGASLSVSYTDEDLALARRVRTRVFTGGSSQSSFTRVYWESGR